MTVSFLSKEYAMSPWEKRHKFMLKSLIKGQMPTSWHLGAVAAAP